MEKKYTYYTCNKQKKIHCNKWKKMHSSHCTRHPNSCAEGTILSSTRGRRECIDMNECLGFPCQHGGVCHNEAPLYRCVCPGGYSGPNCEFLSEGMTVPLTMGAVASMLVCTLSILGNHVIFFKWPKLPNFFFHFRNDQNYQIFFFNFRNDQNLVSFLNRFEEDFF